jgi:hypothetical protein
MRRSFEIPGGPLGPLFYESCFVDQPWQAAVVGSPHLAGNCRPERRSLFEKSLATDGQYPLGEVRCDTAAQRAPTYLSNRAGCPEIGSIFKRWQFPDLLVMFGLGFSSLLLFRRQDNGTTLH